MNTSSDLFSTVATSTHVEVRMSRGWDNKGPLTATTKISIGEHRRELHIVTSKTAFRPGLSSDAKVVQISEDGYFASHAMNIGAGKGSGDFSKKLFLIDGARATEKSILAMHTQANALIADLLVEARAHYASRQVESFQ